jgi:hypothetical protein
MTERIGNPESTSDDPFGHRLQQPRIPFIHLHPLHPSASPSSICIPFIRLEKLAQAPVPTPDRAHMCYAASINET